MPLFLGRVSTDTCRIGPQRGRRQGGSGMADYTPQIDSQIAQLLRSRGTVTPDMISGVSEQDAHDFLRMYVSQHPDEQLAFDGTSLTAGIPSLAEDPAPQAATTGMPMDDVSYGAPVPEVFAAPPPAQGYGAPPPGGHDTPGYTPDAVLREEPSGWLWLLPILLGWIGGIIAWAVVKDKNSRTARNMLVTGIAISVLAACMGFGLGFCTATASAPTDTSWPATGRVTFYYFGSPG